VEFGVRQCPARAPERLSRIANRQTLSQSQTATVEKCSLMGAFMVVYVDKVGTVPSRALQIYQVLVSLAWNRQTITYGKLSLEQMGGYGAGGILNKPLGCIMGWCSKNGLEPLTVLVVNDVTGVPGAGLVTVPGGNWAAAQQRVFHFNWFSIMPPSLDELEEAGAANT
jgi:hypothetical protein